MRIVLYKDIQFSSLLSYDEAVKALDIAIGTPAAEFVDFFIQGKAREDGWSLMGRPIELSKGFLSDPDKYVISL